MSELSKLKWRCRRGVKELDIVMTHYLENFYTDADEAEQHCFRKVLEIEDPELFAYITGKQFHQDEAMQAMLDSLQHALIKARESK